MGAPPSDGGGLDDGRELGEKKAGFSSRCFNGLFFLLN